jgi:hypothetical protein
VFGFKSRCPELNICRAGKWLRICEERDGTEAVQFHDEARISRPVEGSESTFSRLYSGFRLSNIFHSLSTVAR